jgi:hypothetical protein
MMKAKPSAGRPSAVIADGLDELRIAFRVSATLKQQHLREHVLVDANAVRAGNRHANGERIQEALDEPQLYTSQARDSELQAWQRQNWLQTEGKEKASEGK